MGLVSQVTVTGVGSWDRKKAIAPAGTATPNVCVAAAFATRSDLAVDN